MKSARRPPRTARPPKSLRIGILLGGRLVEERLVRDHGPITVGQSGRSTFVVPDDAVPHELLLFTPGGTGYQLVLGDAMDGRLCTDGSLTPLRELQPLAVARPDGTRRLALSDDARGKITIGDVTVLFQLVAAPPPRAAPRLPASVRGGLGTQVDGTMAGVLGGSFAVHLALIVYLGVFVDIPKNVDIEDEFRKLPWRSIPVIVRRSDVKRAGSGESKATAPVAAPRRPPRVAPGAPRPPLSDAERQERARGAAARLGIFKIVGARAPGGRGLLADGLESGSAQQDLDAALKRLPGVRSAATERLTGLASPGGARGGGEVRAIADLSRDVGTVRDTGVATGEKKERRVSVRMDRVREADTEITDVEGVNRTLKNGYGAIKGCYDRGLKRDRALGGKLAVRIMVSGAGTVSTVAVRQETLHDPDVVSCMTATIRGWRFPPAGGGRVAAVEPTWVFKTGD